MSELRYLVIEYWPHIMDSDDLKPARIDGHYAKLEMAKAVAELWAEEPKHPESRIVVAKVKFEAKMLKHWEDLEQ